MDQITSSLKNHYIQCFTQYGATPKGVDWGKQEDVFLRYDKMLSVIREEHSNISILDVGCGYGGLLEYLQTNTTWKDLKISYTGIDVAGNMIDYARNKFKDGVFINGDIFDIAFEKTFDYVICNGILTQKLSASILEMDKFAQKLIKRMFSLCNFGVVFNVMSSKVNFTVSNLYYRNPGELFIYCMDEITPKIRLDHAYPLFEYTMYLYRE